MTTRKGDTREVEGSAGRSVIEVMCHAGSDEPLALCGGRCSCTTYHVHVHGEWYDKLPTAGEDKDDLLDISAFMADFAIRPYFSRSV